MNDDFQESIAAALRRVTDALMLEQGMHGHWEGELSSSALSTATAIIALSTMDRSAHDQKICEGLRWLSKSANADGGWGDTVRSESNLSTTALVWAAFGAARADAHFQPVVARAVECLVRFAGSMENLVPAIEARYGKDKTFSVPITMALALSGRLGADGWKRVHPLPFELAALPRRFFGALRLPVVSYALPALIAIGQVIHHHAPRFNPLRDLSRRRTLEILTTLQPQNGGFLEATPLTSFVTMSLAGMRHGHHPVAQKGMKFLCESVRPDGSWPIDTNLATWVTTLTVKALRHQPERLSEDQRSSLIRWILGQQYRVEHPFTGAAPGGWAWTDLPGGVPDADDTAGALLALSALVPKGTEPDQSILSALSAGTDWLLGLQNGDGGIPTFCRGWGTLPFDRSTPELTAHALRAWVAWLPSMESHQAARVRSAVRKALAYLERSQQTDGFWIPLWFGNERAPGKDNPVYGTAQVLIALEEVRSLDPDRVLRMETQARRWLLGSQHPSGGWGGNAGVDPSIEETSLALNALARVDEAQDSVRRGVVWLMRQWDNPNAAEASPIGLYFAQLWYFERLYPLVFAVDALGRLQSRCEELSKNRLPPRF